MRTPGGHDILAGQIWKECDPRFERFVRIEAVSGHRRGITVRTVVESNASGIGQFKDAPRSRATYCDIERFNGKRGGYSLWRDV